MKTLGLARVLPVEAIFPRRLPWRQMFDDMKAAGTAYSRQASMLGIPWSTFHRWMQDEGPEPPHSFGDALISMHAAICGQELSLQRQREGVLQG